MKKKAPKEKEVKKKSLVVEEKKKPERDMNVPAKLGNLTFKKNKDNSYDAINAEKVVVANLAMPAMMGNGMFLPTYAVWKNDKLDECFASLDHALEHIKKTCDKTPSRKKR